MLFIIIFIVVQSYSLRIDSTFYILHNYDIFNLIYLFNNNNNYYVLKIDALLGYYYPNIFYINVYITKFTDQNELGTYSNTYKTFPNVTTCMKNVLYLKSVVSMYNDYVCRKRVLKLDCRN